MKRFFNVCAIVALVFTIIGAINWLAIGIFGFNIVSWITFGMMWLERLLYILVGINGVFMLVWLITARGRMVNDYEQDRRDYKYSQHSTVTR